jgi:hypothetical protein
MTPVDCLDHGATRFAVVLNERGATLPKHGTREIAFIIDGQVPNHGARFLQLLSISQPHLTGFEPWIDSRRFRERERPYQYDGAWEAFIVELGTEFWLRHIDFWRSDPKGGFYHRRALEDDLSLSKSAPAPLTQLDFFLQISRAAEAIEIAQAFAQVLGCEDRETSLSMAFRWIGLKGRRLTSWVKPQWHIGAGTAQEDAVVTECVVPLNLPGSLTHMAVSQVVGPLFFAFDGYEAAPKVIEEITRETIERRI